MTGTSLEIVEYDKLMKKSLLNFGVQVIVIIF
jgi:hypothetical protein